MNEHVDEDDVATLPMPAFPASRDDFARWSAWALHHAGAGRAPTLHTPLKGLEPEARAQLLTSWRALLAHWVRGRTVSPDDAPVVAHHFLLGATTAPPFVYLAARRLTRASLEVGATSSDVLFLCAAFTWPLRDADPELSELCWRYMIHAPWQTDAMTLKDMLAAVDSHKAFTAGRSVMDLVRAREADGLRASARTMLEAVALLQSKRRHIDQLTSYRDFAPTPLMEGAHEAIVALATRYQEDAISHVHAREVMKRAAELTRQRTLVGFIESHVWDRPLDEAYAWTEGLTHPRMLDDEIDRALAAGQPHHARRLAEAVMVRKFNRVWYGSISEHVSSALERYQRQLVKSNMPGDPIGRRAAEHLATLYVRTHHITQHARHFVHDVATSISFVGNGAVLHPIRDELELFYNASDPYHLMRRDVAMIGEHANALSEDERRASDEIDRWFSDRFRTDNPTVYDRIARLLTSPMVDLARRTSDLPMVEEVSIAALRIMVERGMDLAGDLSGLARKAAQIRSEYGHGERLMNYAAKVTRPGPLLGAATSMGVSLLTPAFNPLAHAADLGVSLLLTFRAVARIAAVFGRDLDGSDGFQFIADTFSLGLSSTDGEGLVTYLSREEEQLLTSFAIGAVGYGSARLVEYLWTAPDARGARPSERLLRQLARLIGVSMTDTAAVRVVPLVGALISGGSTYAFMRSVIDAAIHVAARDALMVRVHSYEDT